MLRPRPLAATLALLFMLLVAPMVGAQYTGGPPGGVFFPDVPVRGPIVVYPTLTVGAEYNDNVFLSNDRRESDVILGITPAIRLILESGTYRWATGYSFTAEKYLDNSQLDDAVQRQQFFITGLHRVDPRLTLTLSELFIESNSTDLVGEDAISVGRRRGRSNSLTPGLTWQFSPRTSLSTSFSWVLQRFDDAGATDSDTYRLNADVNHDLTPRLTGSVGYEIRHIDIEDEPSTTTHTLRLGGRYEFTPTLTGALTVGPTISVTSDDTVLSPYVSASLTQRFAWGSASGYFTRTVGTSGGLGAVTENTSIGGIVQVTTLLRNFIVELAPRYSMSESLEGSGVDVNTFSIDLRAAYRFNTWLSAIAGYRFFRQRSEGTLASLARDVDQNRVFFGMQFGVPIKFD